MCNMQYMSSRFCAILLGFLTAQVKTYPMQSWPMYPQAAREYQDDDYYIAPKVQYYYDAPAMSIPDAYGQVPISYYYDPYGRFTNEAPKRQEERLAALPVGQETWFESDPSPRWRSNDLDDVSAAFLDNLILTQMAQDAQRRRENARAAFPTNDYDDKIMEDEDVKELKALANPMYHAPKTVPIIEDDDDYPDNTFINWNGNKRSVTTMPPAITTTVKPKDGEEEVFMPQPAPVNHHNHKNNQNKKITAKFNSIAHFLSKETTEKQQDEPEKLRRLAKRFIAGDSDLVLELRGLKHRIAT